jgi:hypothetical protein
VDACKFDWERKKSCLGSIRELPEPCKAVVRHVAHATKDWEKRDALLILHGVASVILGFTSAKTKLAGLNT